MRLEDTIRTRLFRMTTPRHISHNFVPEFAIECKAERGKPFPLCITPSMARRYDLVYRKLFISRGYWPEKRAAPRSLYNLIFNNYWSSTLVELGLKDIVYYYTNGALFNRDKQVLFYFAYDMPSDGLLHPKLYITPLLLGHSSSSGKPMEKFFMSTIVPYLVSNDVIMPGNFPERVSIEIDNHADDTFFVPSSAMVTSSSIETINGRLNNVLFDNSDVLSSFLDHYANEV